MNRRQLVTGFLIVLLSACTNASEQDILREFKTELWPKAYRTQDVDLLDRMLHNSFVVITDTGKVSTKQDELEFIANNAWDPGQFEYRIERLDIYGSEYAVIAGQGIADDYTYTSSNVLVKEDGRWQAVSSHVSGVKEKVSGAAEYSGAFHAISVRDVDQAIAWYTEHLGFEMDSRGENEERKGAILSRPGTILELGQFDVAIARGQLKSGLESHELYGIFKLGFIAPDLDSTYRDLETAGVNILFPIVSASDGNRTFGIQDPDGNIIQFFGE